MSKVGWITLSMVLTGVVVGLAALRQAGLNMPWWGWALIGWTGLSFVVGRLVGRWLKSVQLTEDEQACELDPRTGDRDRGTQDRAAVNEGSNTGSALGALEHAASQRLGEDNLQIARPV